MELDLSTNNQQPANISSNMKTPMPEGKTTSLSDSVAIQSCSPSTSSTHSCTSTLGYADVEPFAEFKPRVERLCDALWPPPRSISRLVATRLRTNKLFRSFIPSPPVPLIERLKGGDYNRITSITIPSSYKIASPMLILRTSRWDGHGRPDRDVATLEYVRQRTSIPVPEIVAKDFTSDNVLGKPYVIQGRIPGSDLNSIWDTLSHTQRCTIACEMGNAIRTLLSLESPVPGLIEAASSHTPCAHDPEVVPFELINNFGERIEDHIKEQMQEISSDLKAPQTTSDFFKTVFRKWQAYELSRGFGLSVEISAGLLETVCDMDNMGIFNTDLHCLCHVDLHSRNIMAEVQPDSSIKLTAILDWDEAVFAPKFVNCQPPWWLWKEEGDERVDEKGWPTWPYELPAAENLPATPEKQELKRLFEEHAGPEYRHFASDTYCRLGRGLFILAKDGLEGDQHMDAAERIIREWKELRKSLASE